MRFIMFSVILLLLTSCNNDNKEDFSAVSENEALAIKDGEASATLYNHSPPAAPDRKVIRTADMQLQVEDVDQSTQAVNNLCERYDATVSYMNLSKTNYEVSNRITVRVDSKNFDALIEELQQTATFIHSIEIRSNDVTEEFTDIQTRLQTKRDVRERYINILRNKTGDIEDVLAAEDAIRRITEEIEAKEGRLRYLQNQVSKSTIDLILRQKVNYTEEPEVFEKSFLTKVKEAMQTGWYFIVEVFLLLLRIWPIIILLIIFILWRRKWINRKLRGN